MTDKMTQLEPEQLEIIEEHIGTKSNDLLDLKFQEKLLSLPSFDAAVAFKIGQCALGIAKTVYHDRSVVIDIRTVSGVILFRAVQGSAMPDNEEWIKKKFNTVKRFESSSLKFGQALSEKGRILSDLNLDPTEYTPYGGGFPIRLKASRDITVAVLTISGLKDIEDHYVAVQALAYTTV